MFGIGQDLSKIPNNVLQQAVLGMNPSIQPASALGELNSRIKQARMSQMAMGQQAMGENAAMGGRPPIAAQVMEEAQNLDRGIGALPEAQGVGYEGGGLVSFEKGGPILGYAPGGPTLGFAPDYELAKKYGIVLSPYDSDEVRQQKIAQARTLATQEANTIAGYTDPNRAPRLDESMFPEVAPPTAQAAPGAAARGAGQRPPGPPRAPAAPAAPAAPDEFMKQLARLRANEERLAEQAGTLSPELIQAREEERGMRGEASKARKAIEDRRLADIAKQEAEAEKQRNLSPLDNPALLAAMAGAARGRTLGDVLSGAAGAGGTEYTRQQKEMRDIQDKIRAERAGVDTLTLARMDYDAATQQMKVAELTGDRDKMMAAQTKLAEAQRHLLDVQQKYEYGKERLATDLQVARIQAAAKESGLDFNKVKAAQQLAQNNPEYKKAVEALAMLNKLPDTAKQAPEMQKQIQAHQKTMRGIEQTIAARLGVPVDLFSGVSLDTSGASPDAQADPLGIRKT